MGTSYSKNILTDSSYSDGEWLKIFRHYSGNGLYFSSTNGWAEAKKTNINNPLADKFSLLYMWERFRINGKFTLKLVWPNISPTAINIWSQTSNPVDSAGTGGVTGYIANSIHNSSNGWGGLERYDGQGATFLDGTLVPIGNWYYAVGSTYSWGGTNMFPGPSVGTNLVELYIKYKNVT